MPSGSTEEGPLHLPGVGERTYRQYLFLALLCHTGPPALHRFLFKKGHKPLRVERVIQQVQGALLSCLGGLGHVVEIQLQGACGRGPLSERFSVTDTLSHHPWAQPQGGPLKPLSFHLHSLPPSMHMPTNAPY